MHMIQISLLIWLVIVLPIASMAFPKPTESQTKKFEMLSAEEKLALALEDGSIQLKMEF